MTLGQLERQLIATAREMSRGMVRWLDLIVRFDACEGARAAGFRGTTHWLSARCRLMERTARDYVRVARRLAEWPLVRAALADGRLSYSQVRALTRAAVTEDEQRLLDVALRTSVAALERHVRALRSAASADLDVSNEARERRCLDWHWEPDGLLRVHGYLDPESGAALIEAVETAAAAIVGPRPVRSAMRADALGEIAISGAPPITLMLHADPDALACCARGEQPRAGEVLALRDGPAIPSELARRLTCDAMVSVDGLNHGRTARVVTPALRRALEARDGRRCMAAHCEEAHGLHAHHLIHWIHGGLTELDNLVLLCGFHHWQVHEGGYTLDLRRPVGSRDRREVGEHVGAAVALGVAVDEDHAPVCVARA